MSRKKEPITSAVRFMTLYFIDQDVQKVWQEKREVLTYKGVSVKGKGGMMKKPGTISQASTCSLSAVK